jgi:hypothetical protein
MERSYKEPPAIIRDRVVWMDNSVHSAINKVPALILDCDPSIDMDTDSEAKAMYGAQVRSPFVSALPEACSTAVKKLRNRNVTDFG